VQEEAPTWGVPVLVARRTTERSEAVTAGVASLVGLDGARIERAMLDLLDDPAAHEAMRARSNPFGDGAAAARIAARIADDLGAAPSEDAAAAAVA